VKPASTGCVPALILGVLSLIFAEVASAQVPQLNDLASKIIKEVKPLKPRLVAVVDFRPPYGVDMPQGHYFAWLLSTIIGDKEKKLFVVAEHPAFDADLKRLRLTADALVPGDTLLGAAPVLGAEVLIIGTIERVGNHYALRVVPVRVASSEPLMAISAVIDTSEFLENLLTPLPAGVPLLTAASQAPDITMPSCIYCPDPSYSDLARRERIQGHNLFHVVVTSAGQAEQIRPVKMIGHGLDEQAYYAIKQWKFKPATLRTDGTPVKVIVPVEVAFRLH